MDPAPESKAKTVFRRSRGGCGMCRGRKKKCGEDFDEAGICGRCKVGGYQCDGPPGTSKSAKVSPAPSPYARSLPPIRPKPASSAARSSTPTAAPPPKPKPAPPPLRSSPFLLAPAAPSQYPPPPPPPLPIPQPLTGDAPMLSTFDPLADLTYSSDLLTFFESLEPAVDPAAFASNSDWMTELPPMAGPSTLLEAQQTLESAVSNAPNVEDGLTSAEATSAGAAIARTGSKTEGERVEELFAAEDQAAAIPIYHALNEGFFASLPPPVREVVKARMMDVAFSNELSKSSCMALCLLYRARMSTQEGAPEVRQRLLNQSDEYFNHAVQQLQTGDIPLEAQLLAVFDLELFQLEQYGAAAGYAILLLGDYFLQQKLGPRPALDLLSLQGESTIILRCFAVVDAIRALSLGNRRTLFDFVGAPGASPLPSTEPDLSLVTSEVLSAIMGLPVGIILCIAATCNLAVEEATMPREVFLAKARAIEKSIRTWRPIAVTPEQAEDSIRVMDAFVTHEMWRHAALIHTYQSLFHYGPLHASIKRALAQLLALGSRTSPSLDKIGHETELDYVPLSCATSERACQWFIAATVAMSPQDRAYCREGLRRCKPAKLAQDNLECAERLWAISDETGHTVHDWQRVLEAEGKYVAFL